MIVSQYDSPLGPILLAQDGDALVGLWFRGQKYFPQLTGAKEEETPLLREAKDWLSHYFLGLSPDPRELKLEPKGTIFQKEVWDILLEIPSGSTAAYADIARELARRRGLSRMSAQAVGGAVGHNPISIIIPCHRVVGRNGSLTGYAGGLERKQWLLNHEAQIGCILSK